MTITLQHAKKYRANGWSVFPIKKGTKDEPTVKWGEYRERFATDAEMEEWWGTEESNIGIACGKLSNLTVLDADGIVGINDITRLNLHSSATVLTGGGGKQLFFRHTGETNKWTSKDHQGLDSRGEGGYIVAPPSLHPSGMKYRWASGIVPNSSTLSQWPSGLLESAVQSTGVDISSPHRLPATEPWILKALAGVSSGDRHRTLVRLACYLLPRHHYDIVKQNLIDWNLKNSPPLADEEVVKQLDDLHGRFKRGQYKTTYVNLRTEANNEALDIRTASTAGAYISEQLRGTTKVVPDLPTGFSTLDDVTWGIKRGSIFVIGARPGTGKTSYAVNVTANLCKIGKRVLFFSTEMSHKELFEKFEASEGDIPAFNITSRNFTPDDRTKLTDFIPQFESFDLHIVNLFRPDERAVREAVQRIQPDVMVFDHIQHLATNGDHEYGDISKFTKFLKELAMQNDMGILVASQLSRSAALEGVIPELHHLKGCGTIEEEASVVVLMHDDQKRDDRPILFRVAKNRHGKCGDTTLMFKASVTRFEDMGIQVS